MDTTSLGFQKPKEEEYYDINIFNKNTQLANDLIEKNSSTIGQKLDKDSSFYADLESYYGNTKLIDDFQDISKWTIGAGTQSSDTTNVKIGSQSLKITENDNVAGQVYTVLQNTNINLNVLNNGEISSDNDYISYVFYISDIAKIDMSQGVQLIFSQGTNGETANTKNITFKNNLVNGWNFLKVKKSDFTTDGTGSWEGIKSVRLRWFSTVNAQNAYISFQLIQLIKRDPDTFENKPNPFQKFGKREFDLKVGDWFVGKENNQVVVKCISLATNYSKNALISQKLFSDFIMTVSRITTATTVDAYTCWYVDDNNFVEFFISSVTNKATIRKTVNGVMTVEAEAVPPVKSSDMDVITWEITKKGDEINAGLKIQGQQEKVRLNAKNIGISSPGVMSLGYSGAPKGDYYLSASITELTHAHHSDIAENAIELQKSVRELKGALIGIDLDTVFTPGLYHLNSTCINMPIEGNGFLEVTPHIKGVTTYILQEVTMWKISPYYMRRFQRVRLNGIWQSWKELSWAETPVETVITSGFASGWTGVVRYSKTQEGILIVNIVNLQKTSDISTSAVETIYTLPVGYRPSYFQRVLVIGLNSSAVRINGSALDVYVATDGTLGIFNCGGVTTNVRRLAGTELICL